MTSEPLGAPAPSGPVTGRRPGVTGRTMALYALLGALLAILMLLTSLAGDTDVAKVVTLPRIGAVLAHHLAHAPLPDTELYRQLDAIVWEQRIPRAVCGMLVGMLLAMAGVAFQSLLRNPLADPYMVGVSAGSALGSVLVSLAISSVAGVTAMALAFAPTAGAFVAGLATMAGVYALSQKSGRLSTQTFLLGGIVVGTVLWALLQLVLALAIRGQDPGRAAAILEQQLGSIQFVGWRDVLLLLPFGLAGMAMLGATWRELNIVAQGEESAAHLGLDTEAFKRKVIIAGSLVTAAAVSVSGIIAFVGMVVPHIGRRLVGPDHRALLPAAMLLGAIVVVASDWIARVFLNGIEIGVITSLIGGPVFCYLLRRRLTPP
ncbi:MAG TPA: iron ABC transporter permease [Chthonomonadaceae bacterium]|nr:iron ABC transporter permease [Chthonomonadaceae bacterium]